MPFLTEERRMIQEQAREFTLNEVLPVANKLDPEKGDIPMDLRDKMAELGYFGILIPEEYGGLGPRLLRILPGDRGTVARLDERRLDHRPRQPADRLAEDERGAAQAATCRAWPRANYLGAFSMSEPNAGSDISNISCRAKKDGDSYLISGNKYWCTFADGADFMIIIARTSEAPPGKRHHRPVHVLRREEARRLLPKGCSGSPIPKIGYFGWKTWELAFDNCRVQAADMIGEEGQAFYYATAGLETARAHTAARAIGLAQGALDDSIQLRQASAASSASRSRTSRRSASRSPTWRPQIEAARQLNYFVCEQIDTGQRCDKEASMVQAVRLGDGRAGHAAKACRSMAAPATRRCTPSSATGATPA